MSEQKNVAAITEWLDDVLAKLKRKMSYAIAQAQKLDGVPYTTKGSEWFPAPLTASAGGRMASGRARCGRCT